MTLARLHRLLGLAFALSWLPSAFAADVAAPAPSAEPAAPAEPPWCAPELEALSDGMCAFTPERPAARRTLLIYLHGVIQPGTTWQYGPELSIARAARKHGFWALTPRGRRGIGPPGMRDWWTWPTATAAQHKVEPELFAEWRAAIDTLEQRSGPFERIYILGFSNGAYYGASLAMRAAFRADGFGLFAGGSGAEYLRRAGRSTKHRPPIYVGYGHKDPTKTDSRQLGRMLQSLRWPSRLVGRRNIGHLMADSQVDEAIEFFGRH